MKTFVVLYHAPAEAVEQMQNVSTEEMKSGMEPWMAWAAKCGSALVDLGAPLGNGRKLTGSESAPSTGTVTGYSILQADDMESAQKLMDGHPHLGWASGCEIEIHEAIPLPQ